MTGGQEINMNNDMQEEHERQLEEEQRQAATAQAHANSQLEALQQRLRQAGAELATCTAELGTVRVQHQDSLSKVSQLEVMPCNPQAKDLCMHLAR